MNTRNAKRSLWTLMMVSLCVSFGWQIPLAIAADSGVHGRVMGQNEASKFVGLVGGAQIEIKNQAGAVVAQTKSTPAGYYRLRLGAGSYFYKVTAPGYKTEDEGRGFQVEKSDGLQVFHFALIKGTDDPGRKPPELPDTKIGKLRGLVLERTDRGDLGIPRAVITLRKQGSRQLVRVISGAGDKDNQQAGYYEVTLEAGVWRAAAKARGFEPLVDPEPIRIVAGEDAKRDFILTRQQMTPTEQGLQGSVRFAKPPTATPPAVQLQIVALPTGSDTGDVSFDPQLRFRQELPAGRYRVIARAEGFETAHSAPSHVFADRFTTVNLTLRQATTEEPTIPTPTTDLALAIRVIDQETKKPVEAAKVLVREPGQSLTDAMRSSTSGDGAVTFPVKAEMEYVAMAMAAGYRPGGARVKIAADQMNRAVIILSKTSGAVEDPDPTPVGKMDVLISVVEGGKSQPLKGASVLLRREGQSLTDAVRGVTGPDGLLRTRVDQAGNYIAMARASGYQASGVKMQVGLSSTNKAVIALTSKSDTPMRKPVGVSGAVVYEAPAGRLGFALVKGAAIQWSRIDPAPPVVRNLTSGGTGRYKVELPEGVYEVKIKPPSSAFLPLTERVTVYPGMGQKDFRLKRSERPTTEAPLIKVAGMVLVKGTRKGVAQAWLEWQRDGMLRIKESVRTGDTGGYRIGLPEGDYRVTVRPPKGYQPITQTVRVRRGMSQQNFYVARGVSPVTPDSLATLTGYVWGAKPPSKRRAALARAEVLFIRDTGVAKATTDKRGYFSIRLPATGYRVLAKASGYNDLDTKISVRSGMSPVNLVLNAKRTVQPTSLSIQVRVLEQKILLNRQRITAPLPDATIMLLQKGKRIASGRSSRDGRYTAKVAPGAYDIKVTKTGYVPSAQSVSLSTTAVARDIILRRATDTRPSARKPVLTLRVVSRITTPGRPARMIGVPQADIVVMQGNSRVAVGRTDGNGNYRIPLQRGSYLIKVSGKKIQPAGAMVTIESKDVSRQVMVQSTGRINSLPRIRAPLRRQP